MAFPPTPPEDAELLKSVLSPLLKDFQHWFGRTANRLEAQKITFLSPAEQATLLSRIYTAQKQVSASQAIASVTEGQASIDMPVVMGWHQLAQECWGIALRQRRESPLEKDPTEEKGLTDKGFSEEKFTETSAESSDNQI
ncbi:MAG: DUF2605 domain-containing protein [Phormidesmis sp.]